MRGFQPRASPSREAMALACSRAGPLTDAAVQCREWKQARLARGRQFQLLPAGIRQEGRGRVLVRAGQPRAAVHPGHAGERQLMPADCGEVGGAEIGCPSGGPRCLECGLQPAVAAVALLQRPPPAAGSARPGLVPAGEVVASAAHAGVQGPPGTHDGQLPAGSPALRAGEGTGRRGAGARRRPSRRLPSSAGASSAGGRPGRARGPGARRSRSRARRRSRRGRRA